MLRLKQKANLYAGMSTRSKCSPEAEEVACLANSGKTQGVGLVASLFLLCLIRFVVRRATRLDPIVFQNEKVWQGKT